LKPQHSEQLLPLLNAQIKYQIGRWTPHFVEGIEAASQHGLLE
jgi:hypothetical protein